MKENDCDEISEVCPPATKIQVLMQEYNNLRTQIVHRTNNVFQLLTIGGVMLEWLLSRGAETMTEGVPVWKDWPFGICIVVALVALGLGGRFIFRDVERARNRLAEIRRRVNELAGDPNLLRE